MVYKNNYTLYVIIIIIYVIFVGLMMKLLHCALSIAAQCMVIGPICMWRARTAGGVCYHDNSKLRA